MRAFDLCRTQVNAGMSGAMGLRYDGCGTVLDVYGLNDLDAWDGLQIVEVAWLEHLAEVRERSESRRPAR